MRFCLLNKCRRFGGMLHVGLYEEGVCSSRLQLRRDLLAAFAVSVGKCHFGTFFNKPANRGFSNARGASRNGGYFTV